MTPTPPEPAAGASEIRPRLLIVDDDPATCLAVQAGLGREYEVIVDLGGDTFAETVRRLRPRVVLLDINLPGLNGLKLLEAIQPLLPDILVFMITVRGGEDDILRAFQLGARDYVTKPFSLTVLNARIKRWLGDASPAGRAFRIGETTWDLAAGTVATPAGVSRLSKKEILVMQCLYANAGLVVTREKLLSYAWGYEYEGTVRTVDNIVTALRRRLAKGKGEGDGDDSPITSRRGVGYCLETSALGRS